ncbi:MAG: hypothetical protein WD885_03285 [Candidatus Saccharimonadales bacterium]
MTKGDDKPEGYERFEAVVEKAEALGAEISTIADDLGSASRDSLKAAYTGAEGADLQIFWPIKTKADISQLLKAQAEQRFRGYGLQALTGVGGEEIKIGDTRVVNPFMSNKYYNHALEEAYGSENPREDFINDLAKWAEEMEQRGWPTLVRVDLNERHRLEVSLYEDQQPARDYLQARADGAGITEDEAADGHRPDVWASERVLIGGDEALAAAFSE